MYLLTSHKLFINLFTLIAQDEQNLPFLITSLVSKDRQLSNTISNHVQWLEKLFGGVEMYGLTKKKPLKKIKKTDIPVQEEMKFVYDLQMPFQHDFTPITLEEITSGYHVPLPRPFCKNCYTYSDYDEEHVFFRSILHYTNYMYPLTVDSHVGKKSKSTGESHVSVAQRFAVGRVNYWINTRFVRDLLDRTIIIPVIMFFLY